MQPGIYQNISNDAYHMGPGVSKTDLKLAEKSLKTYRAIKNGEIPKKETIYKDLGKAFHELVLEPEEFKKHYCKPLTIEAAERQGIKVLEDREKIQAMVDHLNTELRETLAASGMIQDVEHLSDLLAEMNKTRLPKLSTTGNKAELIARIMENIAVDDAGENGLNYGALSAMKGPELKAQIEALNETREGLLSTSGSKADLLARYRENGGELEAVWEYVEAFERDNDFPMLLGSGKSRAEMIDWLNAHGYKGGNWRSWEMVKAEWAENNPDRTILTEEEWTKVHGMRDALMDHPWARKLLWPQKGGVAEQSIYWTDKETGELCRCRPDFMRYDNRPVDLKSANDASEEGFKKAIETYGYDMQQEFYLDGIEAATGVRPPNMPFVVVESEAPYLVNVHVLGLEYCYIGKGRYRTALNAIHEAKESGEWPGYPEDIHVLEPRRFYAQQHAQYLPDSNW